MEYIPLTSKPIGFDEFNQILDLEINREAPEKLPTGFSLGHWGNPIASPLKHNREPQRSFYEIPG